MMQRVVSPSARLRVQGSCSPSGGICMAGGTPSRAVVMDTVSSSHEPAREIVISVE